jgi:hypothetical protein
MPIEDGLRNSGYTPALTLSHAHHTAMAINLIFVRTDCLLITTIDTTHLFITFVSYPTLYSLENKHPTTPYSLSLCILLQSGQEMKV